MKKLAACTWIRKEWCDMESTLLGSSRQESHKTRDCIFVFIWFQSDMQKDVEQLFGMWRQIASLNGKVPEM